MRKEAIQWNRTEMDVERVVELVGGPSLLLLSILKWRRYFPPQCIFLQEPHGITSQKTALFIVTAVETSNLT
jgi:hypothetical protein